MSPVCPLLSDITTKDLERFIGEAVAPATKNRCLGALRIFLGWAVCVGLIEKLPTVGIQRVHEQPRTRVLSDDEIRILIRKFDETATAAPCACCSSPASGGTRSSA